jgi:hypothetical protein
MHFKEMPTNWNLELRGHRGPGCGSVFMLATNSWSYDCLYERDGNYGGGSYRFMSKRSIENEECQETVAPSILAFGNDAFYNLTDINPASLNELVCTCYYYREVRY